MAATSSSTSTTSASFSMLLAEASAGLEKLGFRIERDPNSGDRPMRVVECASGRPFEMQSDEQYKALSAQFVRYMVAYLCTSGGFHAETIPGITRPKNVEVPILLSSVTPTSESLLLIVQNVGPVRPAVVSIYSCLTESIQKGTLLPLLSGGHVLGAKNMAMALFHPDDSAGDAQGAQMSAEAQVAAMWGQLNSAWTQVKNVYICAVGSAWRYVLHAVRQQTAPRDSLQIKGLAAICAEAPESDEVQLPAGLAAERVKFWIPESLPAGSFLQKGPAGVEIVSAGDAEFTSAVGMASDSVLSFLLPPQPQSTQASPPSSPPAKAPSAPSPLVQERIENAKRYKELGNDFLKQANFKKACFNYKVALTYVKEYATKKGGGGPSGDDSMVSFARNALGKNEAPPSAEQVGEVEQLVLSIHLNLAQAYIKREEWDHVLEHATDALILDAKNIKALYRRGKAYFVKRDLDAAKKDWQLVEKEDPAAVAKELKDLDKAYKELAQKEKAIYSKMFK